MAVFEPQTMLVTGGAGFIGSNFVRFVLAERPGTRVVNLDALTYAGNPANLADVEDNPNYRFIHGDIRDAATVQEAMKDCDCVVHFAAESHVDRSIDDASPFLSTNVLGTQNLLEAARASHSVERFLQVGTDEVYGELPLNDPTALFTESTPLQPNSPYSVSKAAGDMLALAAHHTYDTPTLVTRCSNNFGPYQFPEKVIPLFTTNLIQGQPVPLYGDGRNVRDWLHVLDHCEALLTVLEGGRLGEVYNIGGNNEQSNRALTDQILELFDCDDSMIRHVTDRLGHDLRYAIDASKIKNELGWTPSRSAWPDGLADTVAWYKAHEAWWKPLLVAH